MIDSFICIFQHLNVIKSFTLLEIMFKNNTYIDSRDDSFTKRMIDNLGNSDSELFSFDLFLLGIALGIFGSIISDILLNQINQLGYPLKELTEILFLFNFLLVVILLLKFRKNKKKSIIWNKQAIEFKRKLCNNYK